MEVNLNKPFLDYLGNPVQVKEKNVMIFREVSITLFNLSTIGGAPVSQEQKYLAYLLCNRISQAPDCVEMSTEDAAFLKQVCGEKLSAGAYGQIVDLIEGKK